MSVVAWDGKTLAADKLSVNYDMSRVTKKIYKAGKFIYAYTGLVAEGLELIQWHKDGADPHKYPAFQTNAERFTRLIIVSFNQLEVFEMCSTPIKFPLQEFRAWGSGRDFAIGALAMGATAIQAVEITSQYNVYCGGGVDAFEMDEYII